MTLPSRQQARTWSRGLGWFSLGLGVVELLAARPLSRSVGLRDEATLMRAYGLREIVTGLGLLRSRDPTPFVWARVAGDALDLATLARGLHTHERRGATTALVAVAGVTLLDLACARALSTPPKAPPVDYSKRSGWPLPADEMRGAALADFTPPRDMSIPAALRPLGSARINRGDEADGSPAMNKQQPGVAPGTQGPAGPRGPRAWP